MLAYIDGECVTRIKTIILSHNEMRERNYFLSGSANEADNQLLLTYIIDRYANMRGTYFAGHLKGNREETRSRKWLTVRQKEPK